MLSHYSQPLKAREKIYRDTIIKIRKNLDQWFRGDKFYDPKEYGNDGDHFVDEVEYLVAEAMDKGESV
jgi:hypothetical protein